MKIKPIYRFNWKLNRWDFTKKLFIGKTSSLEKIKENSLLFKLRNPDSLRLVFHDS